MITSLNKVAFAFFAMATFFFQGCKTDPEVLKKLSAEEELKPLNVQRDIVYEYSDSAVKRLELHAPIVTDFSVAEPPYLEFAEGIVVTFFDKFGKEESHLRANYAKQLIKEQLWEARGDVIIFNKKGEELKTEHLFWDVNTEKIYSDEFVKITTGDEVIMGEGFEADQSFTTYTIKGNVKGELKLKEEEGENK